MRSIHYLLRKPQHKIQKTRYLFRRWRTVPKPYRMIFASPNNVLHYLNPSRETDRTTSNGRGQFSRRKNVGKVLSGSWDKKKDDFENLEIYRSYHKVFVKGKKWEETDFIKNALEQINQGKSIYGCGSEAELFQKRVKYIENLYNSVSKNGYQKQGTNPSDKRDRGKGHEGVLHEINVSIGRNGELLFNNTTGHNRLSIAKVLELNQVPMTVIVRHKLWQKTRKEVYSAESLSQLSEKARKKLNHPDIRRLHDFGQSIS